MSAGPDATRPADEGDYAFTVTVRDRAGNLARGAGRDPERRGQPSRHRRVGGGFTLEGPLDVGGRRLAGRARGRPARPQLRLRAVALRRPQPLRRGGPDRAAASGSGCRATRKTGVYLVRVRSGDRRAVWPLAVARPAADRAASGAPAGVLPALTLAGPQPGGRRPRRLCRHPPRGLPVRLDRHFARRRAAATLRRRGGAAAALPRPRAARLRPDHRPLPGAGRGPGARGRARRGLRRQRAVAARAAAEGRLRDYVEDGGLRGLVRRRRLPALGRPRGRDAQRPLGPPQGRTRSASAPRCSRTSPSPLTVFEDELGLFRGLTEFVGEFERLRAVARPHASAARACAPAPAGRRRSPHSWPTSSATASWSARAARSGRGAGGGAPEPRAAASDEAHLAQLAARQDRLTRLPS